MIAQRRITANHKVEMKRPHTTKPTTYDIKEQPFIIQVMYCIYNHGEERDSRFEFISEVDDERIDAWVCAANHPDRTIFDEAGADVVYNTLDEAYEACLVEDVEYVAASEAWQRKEGQNRNGGLNAKGRTSYNKTHHGHLKAPSKDKKNKRRKSFCARMKGMKQKLTSKKTAQDPDSRINKSLRAWGC